MSKLNTKNYDDAINEYYDLKQQYKVSKDKEIQTFLEKNEKLSWREKRNLFKSLNYKCINCKRYVGSIFKTTVNVNTDRQLIAKCGDKSNPCPLQIEIDLGITWSYIAALDVHKEQITDEKINIIKDKNNLLFGYISSKTAIAEFDKFKKELASNIEIYEDTNKSYLEITNNIEQKEKIVQLQQEIYIIINTIKVYIKQYESSNNPALINDAVKLYTEELIEKIKELNMLNFAYKAIEYDVDSNTYTFVKKQYSVEQMEINLGESKVISFIIGLGSDADKEVGKEVGKETVVKKKSRKTKTQIAEEEKAIDQLPDKFGPNAVKKSRTARKQANPVKNKTVKRVAKKVVPVVPIQFEIESGSDSENTVELNIPATATAAAATATAAAATATAAATAATIADIDWSSNESDKTVEIEGKGVDLGLIEELPSQVSQIYSDDLPDEDYNYNNNKNENNESDKITNDPFDKI